MTHPLASCSSHEGETDHVCRIETALHHKGRKKSVTLVAVLALRPMDEDAQDPRPSDEVPVPGPEDHHAPAPWAAASLSLNFSSRQGIRLDIQCAGPYDCQGVPTPPWTLPGVTSREGPLSSKALILAREKPGRKPGPVPKELCRCGPLGDHGVMPVTSLKVWSLQETRGGSDNATKNIGIDCQLAGFSRGCP